ncbi:ABC transporter substrate-binding protein [Amycolatopsis sp. cg5]|uniref:ABC transporter substrate-binding protein n=1 Tax=Amycolatopsis sp. cg5 TaxID=3238802 RepID=UPI0035232646
MKLRVFTVALLALTAACAPSVEPSKESTGDGLDKVTLTLNWYPYGEHAPFYYGKKKGIFAKHKIDLNIQAGQGSQKTVQVTGGGQTDFGWADTSALLGGVGQGMPVKSVGVFLQKTPSSVQFFTDKNITKPADLKGKTIASTAGDALTKTFPIFLKANGMSESDVVIQNTDAAGKIAAVLASKTDALLGYATDQGPTIAEKAGKPVSSLKYADFGLSYFSNGLVAQDKTIADRKDLVRRMVAATTEAWTAASGDVPGAVEAMAGASEQLPSPKVLTDQFNATIQLLHTDATKSMPPGVNDESDWKKTITVFADAGLIKTAEAPSKYWDASFAVKG